METSIFIIHTFVTLENQAWTAGYYQEVKMNFTFKSSEGMYFENYVLKIYNS